MENFLKEIKNLTISDLEAKLLEAEAKLREAEAKRREAEAKRRKAEAKLREAEAKLREDEAKRLGTYLEDCDGLWSFTREKLPKEKVELLTLFDKISRKTLRKCYENIDTRFDSFAELPDPSMNSLGSASFSIAGKRDIFYNEWNNKRAHLIPDSPVCAPNWGHCAEGALQPLTIDDDAKKNQARKLLVMGYHGSPKLRQKPQNFIYFAAHKKLYDVDPSVIIIPTMPLSDVIDWEADTAYDALVIASTITKSDRSEPYMASSTYRQLLPHFEYKDEHFCSPQDIDQATSLIRDFLVGHAGSLAAGIPTDIDPDNSSDERKDVMAQLEKSQQEIINNGVALPSKHLGKTFRKVLKVRFSGEDGTPIPDPWLLAAKAAVNLSSTRGHKLLPVCKEAEEDDYEILQELYEYQMRRRRANLPVEVDINCTVGDVPDTPPQTRHSGGVAVTPPQVNHSGDFVVTPPRESGDDWENLGD